MTNKKCVAKGSLALPQLRCAWLSRTQTTSKTELAFGKKPEGDWRRVKGVSLRQGILGIEMSVLRLFALALDR